MSSPSHSDDGFVYPDPTLYILAPSSGLANPRPSIINLGQDATVEHRVPAAAPAVPATVPATALPPPPFALDPALLALPGPATVPTTAPVIAALAPTTAPAPSTAPVVAAPAAAPAPIVALAPAPFAGAPRLSVVGMMFPGFPAGLVPPMQINGRDAARYNELVAGMIPLDSPPISETLAKVLHSGLQPHQRGVDKWHTVHKQPDFGRPVRVPGPKLCYI